MLNQRELRWREGAGCGRHSGSGGVSEVSDWGLGNGDTLGRNREVRRQAALEKSWGGPLEDALSVQHW